MQNNYPDSISETEGEPVSPTKSEVIRHPGVVTEVSDGVIRVKILQVSACAQCAAKGACSVTDMAEKIVEVDNYRGRSLKPGDNVTLAIKRSTGTRAVFLGYLVPFLLMMTIMITGSFFISREGLLALVSIGSVVPYYMGLYYFRNRLKKGFKISIEDQAGYL